MFYRVRADLLFTEPDEARDFYHDCEGALPKSETIHPGLPTEEIGHIILEKCFHDEEPSQPCEVLNEEYSPE